MSDHAAPAVTADTSATSTTSTTYLPRPSATGKERITALGEIVREFETLVAAGEKRLRVVVTTAQELTDEEASALIGTIEAATGRQVEARRHVDPSMIGGLVVRAGSLRLDASIRGRIEKLRTELVETRS